MKHVFFFFWIDQKNLWQYKRMKKDFIFFWPHCWSNVKNPPWKLTKTSNQGLEILALWWWGWELTRNHKQAQEVWQPNLFFNSITALMFLAILIWSTMYRKSFFFFKPRSDFVLFFLRNFYNSKLILLIPTWRISKVI